MIKNTSRITNSPKLALTGGHAAAEAFRQIGPDVMPVYPITPQTPIIETYAKFASDGKVDTEVIQVESEHSAMSAAVGASAAGARTVTATSSQGLAYMNEVLYIASGMRLPILMVVSARALASPINIHGDHSDVMGARDAGWIQLFCENPQEVYDKTIIGMRLAESCELPVMVIMDGFNTSHSVENMEALKDEEVKKFVGSYSPGNSLLNVSDPVTYGFLALQNSYFEFKIEQEKAMLDAKEKYLELCADFEKISGRKYSLFEEYAVEDAEKILILMGSAAGTVKDAADVLRSEGEKVGVLRVDLFRPFPFSEIAETLKGRKEIFVLDRAQSIGSKPPLYSEIASSLYPESKNKAGLRSFVFGLGGRDLFQEQIREAVLGKNKKGYLS